MPPVLDKEAKKEPTKSVFAKEDPPISTDTAPTSEQLNKAQAFQFVNSAEEYLSSNGWRKVSVDWRGQGIWQDPVGDAKTVITETIVTLPSKEKGTETIKQKVGSPVKWDYSAEEAVHIQRTRDEYKNKK